MLASVMGLGGVTPAPTAAAPQIRALKGVESIVANSQTRSQEKAMPAQVQRGGGAVIGMIGGMGDGLDVEVRRRYGRTPYEFGISPECRRLRRKNKLRGWTGRKGVR
jgi:hypothetical protein